MKLLIALAGSSAISFRTLCQMLAAKSRARGKSLWPQTPHMHSKLTVPRACASCVVAIT